MRLTTQNLTEKPTGEKSHIFFHGRAWLRSLGQNYKTWAHWEWLMLWKARDFSLTINFGSGDGDDGILFHVCIPFLFSIYFGIDGICRFKKECHTGIAIHNQGVWFYPLPYVMESNSRDPWWRKTYHWPFPWELNWYSTEILEHKANLPSLCRAVYVERGGDRQRLGIDSFQQMRNRDEMAETVSETYDYTYKLKNGDVQNRKATIHVNRMKWRARWWPLIPIRKESTSIDIKFDKEVGEESGSWKGGCTGCGCEMNIGETPLMTLRRMESERKF